MSTSKALSRLSAFIVTVLTVCFVAVTVMAGGQVKLSFEGEVSSNSGTYIFNAQYDGYSKDEDIKFSFYAKDSSGNAINKAAQWGNFSRVGGGHGQDGPGKIKVSIEPDGKINVTISKDSWVRKNNQTPITIYGNGISGYTGLKYEKSKGDNPPPPGPGPDDPKPKDPTATPAPTATNTPAPTATNTPAPTNTPKPTNTPVPTKPAATATPVPTKAESSGGDNSKSSETTAASTTAQTTRETAETTLNAVIISDATNTPKPKHKATNTPSPKKDDKKDNKKDDKKDDKKPSPTSKPIAVVTAAPTETTKKSEETTVESTTEAAKNPDETVEGQVSETAPAETSETAAETSEETTESSYVAAAIVRQWATEDPNQTGFNPLWLLLLLILLIVAAYLRYRQLKNKGYKGNDIVLYFIPGTYMTVEGIMNSFGKKNKKTPVIAYPETGSTKTGGYNAASAMKELSKMNDPAKATAVGKTTETVNSTAFKAPIKRPKPQSSAPTRPAASAAAAAKRPVAPATASPAPAVAAAPAAAAGLLGKKKEEKAPEAYPVTRSTTATTNYAAQMKALKQEESMNNNTPSPFKPAPVNNEPEKTVSAPPVTPEPEKTSSSPIAGLAGLFGRKKEKEKPVEAYPQTKSTTATTNYAAQMKALKMEEDKSSEEVKPTGFTGQKPEPQEKPGSKFSSNSGNRSRFNPSSGRPAPSAENTMNRPERGSLNMNATPTAASASFRNNFKGTSQTPAPSLATQPIPPVKEKKVVEEKKSPFKPINVEGSDSAPANNLTKRDDNGNPLVVNGYLQKSNTTPIRPVSREKSASGVFSGIVRPGSKESHPTGEPHKNTPVAAALTKSNEPSALKAEDLFITEEPKKINPFKPIDPSKINGDPDSAEKA